MKLISLMALVCSFSVSSWASNKKIELVKYSDNIKVSEHSEENKNEIMSEAYETLKKLCSEKLSDAKTDVTNFSTYAQTYTDSEDQEIRAYLVKANAICIEN